MARRCRLASYRADQLRKTTHRKTLGATDFPLGLAFSVDNYDGHITQPKPDPANDGQLAQPGLYMNRLGWKFVLRLALPVAAMLVFYGFASLSISANAGREHRGDTGLGIAIVLGFLCFVLLVGYLVDLVIQLVKRQPALVAADLLVLGVLSIPFGWVSCNWYGMVESAICRLPLRAFGALLNLLQI